MVVMQVPAVEKDMAFGAARFGHGWFASAAEAAFPRVRPVGTKQSSTFCLDAEQLIAVDKPSANLLLEVRSGVVWVTQADCSQDVVLRVGDAFTPQGDGKMVIAAMEKSAVRISMLD